MTAPSRNTCSKDRTACGRPPGPRSMTPTHALGVDPRTTRAREPSGETRTARISPALSDSMATSKAPSAPPPTLSVDADVAGPHTQP